MSQVDQKRAYNKLKHELEPWRNLIVQTDAILKWEKNYFPAVIVSAISAFYLLLWLLDLTTITMLSLIGLFFVSIDVVYPIVARYCYNVDSWSGIDEARFEDVCSQMCNIKSTFIRAFDNIMSSKEQKSTIFRIIISALLIILAWLGSAFDNLLLMYLTTLTIALYPGIYARWFASAIKKHKAVTD